MACADYEAEGEHLLVLSVHVPTGPRQQSALRLVFDRVREVGHGRRCIVGGDFNATRGSPGNTYGWFFDAMNAAGFRDCHCAALGREVRNYWGKSPARPRVGPPIQDDHVFDDEGMSARGGFCSVVDAPEAWPLSDHGPVVIELVSGAP